MQKFTEHFFVVVSFPIRDSHDDTNVYIPQIYEQHNFVCTWKRKSEPFVQMELVYLLLINRQTIRLALNAIEIESHCLPNKCSDKYNKIYQRKQLEAENMVIFAKIHTIESLALSSIFFSAIHKALKWFGTLSISKFIELFEFFHSLINFLILAINRLDKRSVFDR